MLDTNSVGIWNNSVYSRTKKKTMKRSQLVKVIKEELGRKQTLNENLDAIITKYIETDDATELKAYFKSLPDKARTKLAKIFKIDLNEDGYEKKDGKLVPHSDKFDSTKLSSILTRIAKDRPEEKGKYQGDPVRGNKILDRGNPNITLDEAEGKQYSKQELIDYLDNLSPEMEVAIPEIHMSGNFDFNVKWRTTAAKAAQALSDTPKEGEFTLWQDNPTYKSFSLVQSPEELEKRTKFMQDFGGLD